MQPSNPHPYPHTEYYLFGPYYSQIFLIVGFEHMRCPVKRWSLPADFSLMASVRTFSWWEKIYIACKLCVVIQGLPIWLSFAAFSVSLCRFWISTESTGHVKDLSVCRASQEFALLGSRTRSTADEINCVSWGQQLLAAAGDDKTVRIYDVTKEPRPGAGSWSHNVHNIQIGE